MRDDVDALAQLLSESSHRKVYGYVRVSSNKQEKGLSLDGQEDLIRTYAKDHDLGEPLIVRESSTAGKRMFKLPKLGNVPVADSDEEETEVRQRLMLLLGHVTSIPSSHLIVWKLDRIARLNDEREMLYQLLQRYKVSLHSTDPNEQFWLQHGDPDDPMTALVRQVFGAFSQYEKAMIEMRMLMGLRFKGAKAGYTGGRPPYGYRVVDHELVVDSDQKKMVRYIFMLSKKYGMGVRQISSTIEEALPDGEKFGRTKVHRILQHEPLYRGVYRDRFKQTHERPDLKILDDGDDFDYDKEFQS